jgi:hypothetical protein
VARVHASASDPPTVPTPSSQTSVSAAVPHDGRVLKEDSAAIARAGRVLQEDGDSGYASSDDFGIEIYAKQQ